MSVPSAFRDQLAGAAYVTRGFERNLLILTADAFQEIYRRVKSLNMADPLARLLLRMILGSASELSMDSDHRLTVPAELRDFAELGDRALLIGQGDYLEVWSPDLWSKQEAILSDAEANAGRFSMLTIATK